MSGWAAARGAAAALGLAAAACAAEAPQPPLWERPPPPIPEGPVVPAERLSRSALENGLRLLVLEDRRLPRLTLGVVVRRGAAREPLHRAGLAELTAEVMRRGAGPLDATALAGEIDRLGARLRTGADWDAMDVVVSGLSRDLDELIRILSEVVRRPRFTEAEVARARAEALARLEQARDDPGTLAFWSLTRVLYAGHRFGLPLAGSPESVAGLDADALREFHAESFVAGNAIAYAVGDVDPGDVRARLERAFGDWPAGVTPDPGPPAASPTPTQRRVVVVDRPDLEQAQILFGHEGMARTDPERIAVGLMNTILGGGGFSSRLMRSVRAERGLTYGVYSAFATRRRPGPFFVSVATRADRAGRAVDLVLAELERVRSDVPSEEEVRAAKSGSVGRFALGLETSAAVAESLVDLDVYGLPEDSLDTFRSRVADVGVEEVARAARGRIHPRRIAIVAVGPAARLIGPLESFGPVEVVSP